MIRLAILLALFNVLLWVGRVKYVCQPYTPKEECETSSYRVDMYSYAHYRYPVGRIDAHCVAALPGRYLVTTVRMITFEDLSTEISNVEWFDKLEIPTRNVEICKVQ